MVEKVEVFWGSDKDFEDAIAGIQHPTYLVDVFNHINQTKVKVDGVDNTDPPLEVENLIIHTDDYGGIQEWALMGFSINVIENLRLKVSNVWMCNPPLQIYDDIKRTYVGKIEEHKTEYPKITEEALMKISKGYDKAVIGQPHVIQDILPAIYSLIKKHRKKPATLLFLGTSGIGKTETANFIGDCIGNGMVRIQFSMQQTNNAVQYIFGGGHGEDSLARRLIRRKSNLILLDEFDKVSPGFYNAFYQMFDEGEFVDKNYRVDVSDCIIICTSNFLTEKDAEKNLGSAIYSRFTKVLRFEQISEADRIRIAEISFKRVFDELSPEEQGMVPKEELLDFYSNAIQKGAYNNIRMLRSDIEESIYFEILRAKKILP